MSFGIVATVGVGLLGASASRSAANKAANASRESTDAQAQATSDRLEFDKQQYADGAGNRQFASDTARKMSVWQGEDRAKYNTLQDEQIARGRKFQASEDRMLVDANNYDTEGKRNELAGLAMADVNQGFASAEGQNTRAQQRMGINPSSGRALALGSQTAVAKAAALAGAATGARRSAETTGYARKMDALGLGKGMIGNQATQASLQQSAGNSSVNNAQVPFSLQQQAGNSMSQGFGNAAYGLSNLAGNQQGNYISAQNYGNGVGASVGNMFGSLATKFGPGLANSLNFGTSGNSYNGSSNDSSAANYTNQYDLM